MATKNFFALERPRRVSISIPGYDAKRAIGEQEHRARKQRQRSSKLKAPTPEAEVAALAASLAVSESIHEPEPGLKGLAEAFDDDTGGLQ